MVPVDLRIVTKSTTRRARKNQLPFCKKVCFPACSRYALDNHCYAEAFAWACLQDMLRMHDPGLHQVVFSWHISIYLGVPHGVTLNKQGHQHKEHVDPQDSQGHRQGWYFLTYDNLYNMLDVINQASTLPASNLNCQDLKKSPASFSGIEFDAWFIWGSQDSASSVSPASTVQV